MRRLLFFLLLLPACTPAFGDDDDVTGDDDDATLGDCTGPAELPEACIAIASGGTFSLEEAAAGLAIPWEVQVSADVTVTPTIGGASGCANPGPSGLVVFERLSGSGELYCLCDEGLCKEPAFAPTPLTVGSYPGTFTWTGRNWTGPSDTGNPMGEPFPPGTYTLEVSAAGEVDDEAFRLVGTYELTLTE